MAKKPHKNHSTAFSLVLIAIGMLMLTFASVPLYRVFCQVTGFGGTTQAATSLPDHIYDRNMTILFDAQSFSSLPWKFEPMQNSLTMKVGENKMAYFRATNLGDKVTHGTATFNVTPNKIGQYFVKTQCFCFNEQTLEPHESVEMPVSFYIDPQILNDEDADDVTTITLSYTFFPVENPTSSN